MTSVLEPTTDASAQLGAARATAEHPHRLVDQAVHPREGGVPADVGQLHVDLGEPALGVRRVRVRVVEKPAGAVDRAEAIERVPVPEAARLAALEAIVGQHIDVPLQIGFTDGC